MRRLRTASTRRLVTIAAVLVAVAAGAGIAQAALNSAPKPDPKPLDRAVHDALNAPAVEGVTARIEFTNNLLPSGSLPENTASPVLTGATGRLWLAGDGRLRLELQSTNGDAQIVADGERFMVYDAASKTAYVGRLPQSEDEAAARRSAPVARRRPARARPARPGLDALRRHPDLDRAASRPTRSGSPRRTTAACSARSRWPGTPSAACRCARRSTPRAPTTRCSRSRRPTSPTARSPRARSTPPRPRAPR